MKPFFDSEKTFRSKHWNAKLASLVTLPLFIGCNGKKAFDEQPYHLTLSWDAPMDTLAALTDWGQQILDVYGITTWITLVIFFAVCLPVVYALWKFRAKERVEEPLPKQVHGSVILESLWTFIPIVLLIFIAVPTWQVIFDQAEEPPADALHVDVIGHQWWWEFRYPSLGIVTANELVLPENTPVVYKVTSADVIHSFWIPKFGGKIDALPGVNNRLFYTTPPAPRPLKPEGTYYQGQCAELCGDSHALMRFEAVLMSKEQFASWAKSFNTEPLVRTSREQRGKDAFPTCLACHAIGPQSPDVEISRAIGPSLTNFGNRRTLGAGTRLNTEENLKAWLREPAHIKPGSLMPNFQLSEQAIDDLAAYLRFSTVKEF